MLLVVATRTNFILRLVSIIYLRFDFEIDIMVEYRPFIYETWTDPDPQDTF